MAIGRAIKGMTSCFAYVPSTFKLNRVKKNIINCRSSLSGVFILFNFFFGSGQGYFSGIAIYFIRRIVLLVVLKNQREAIKDEQTKNLHLTIYD